MPPPKAVFVFLPDSSATSAEARRSSVLNSAIRSLSTIEGGLSSFGKTAEANEVAYRRMLLDESMWGEVTGDWIFGHGVRMSNPMFLLLAASVLFAWMFHRWGVYYQPGNEISLKLAALPLTVQTTFLPAGFHKAGLVRCWMLSVVLLSKLSFGCKYATYRRNCVVWAKFEWIIGLVFMTAFTICLIKNFPELKELLHGIIG